jgi:uncharacterized membrane protein
MTARNVFLINVVTALVYAIAFLFLPQQTADLYGVDLTPGGTVVARLYGGTLVTFVVLLWALRNLGPTPERQVLILSLFAGDAIGTVVSLLAVLSGAINALGWATVVMFLFFAVAYGYLRFIGEGTAARAQMAG